MFFLVVLFIGGGAWYLYERSQRHSYPVSPGLRPEIELPHTDEWELYQNSLSLCSKKLRVCIQELELPYRDHHVHLIETGGYGNLSRDFLKVNPAFTVPVLVHKGHPIYESDEQIVYAAQHAGDRGAEMLGATDAERSEVARWIDLGALKGVYGTGLEERAGSCVPGMTVPIFTTMMAYIPYTKLIEGFLFHPELRRPALFATVKFRGIHNLPEPLVRLIQAGRRGMMVHMDELEKTLSRGQPWICGDRFTLADVSWMVILERLVEVDWDNLFWGEGRRPQVAAYWERLSARPSYDKALLSQRGDIARKALEDLKRAKRESPKLRAMLETD